jgi:hypothetical protein
MTPDAVSRRVFILSPASCRGRRAAQLLSPRATMPLASQLRSTNGAPLGDVFTFFSSLYFRGKLTYARHFAAAGDIHVITPTCGLQSPDVPVTQASIIEFAAGDIDVANARYRRPLEETSSALARDIGTCGEVVLLGSIASPKYVEVLGRIFGDRLRFPIAFVGRGDMSRGGLLLRKASEGVELDYVPVAGAVRHGPRPPRLPAKPRS